MTFDNKNINRFGGVSFLIASALLLGTKMSLFPVPGLPSDNLQLQGWLADWKINIITANELYFFAIMFLIPSFFSLYRVLVGTAPVRTFVGCGIIAVTVPVLAILDVVQGRLVYPVYNLALSPDTIKLVFSIYVGGIHSANILLGTAIIVLSFATVRSPAWGKVISYLGFAAGIFLLIGAYPWLIGPVVELVSQILFSAWLVLAGIKILTRF